MKRLLSVAMAAVMSLVAGAQNKEQKLDTLVVTTTPKMRCENCAKKIVQNVRFVKGTKKVEPSVPRQEVVIVYDPRKATPADYEKAFGKIGYEVRRK